MAPTTGQRVGVASSSEADEVVPGEEGVGHAAEGWGEGGGGEFAGDVAGHGGVAQGVEGVERLVVGGWAERLQP